MDAGIEPKTTEQCANDMRAAIKEIEKGARAIAKASPAALNADVALAGEQRAQSMLAVRHLEDARMRLGKVIQYAGDGASVYDK